MRTKSLYVIIGLLYSLVHPLNANERDSVPSVDPHSSYEKGSTTTMVDESQGSMSSSSVSSSSQTPKEPSDHFLCRVCGNTLFSRDQHLHGPLLTGPRIVSVRHEPELGEHGALHDISRSNVNGFVSTALFDPSLPNGVAVGASSDSSTFVGYNQRQVLCGRCGQPIGWRFDSASSIYASGPASGGSRASVGTSSGSSTVTAQGAVPPVSVTSPAVEVTDPYANVPKIVAPYSDAEEDLRLSSLLNAPCLPFSRGYWSFEYCHKHRVNQFHSEPNGVKDPLWSLGDYDTSGKVERTRPLSSASGYYTSHFYTGGQLCHETNKGRSSEVQFFCCPHIAVPSLEEVEEPSICRYRIRVCVPSACIPEPNAVAALTSAAKVILSKKNEGDDTSASPMDASPAPTLSPNREDDLFDEGDGTSSSSPSSPASTQESTSTTSDTDDEKGGLSSTPNTGKPSLYGPGSLFDPKKVPSSFIAAAWHTILGDKGETMKELEEGDLNTGIAQVRI